MKRIDVYGIGNAIMDLQLEVADEDVSNFKLTKGSMTLVEVSEQKTLIEYFHDKHINQTSGGSAANTVIAISQLGGTTAYGCLTGDDGFGDAYRSEMREIGVLMDDNTLPGGITGTCVVLITPDAERTMNTHLGASSCFGAKHVSEELIRAAQWLYVEGYLFASEDGRQAAQKAIAFAKAHGTRVAVTFSDGFIVTAFRDALTEAVSSADLIFANKNEASTFANAEDEDVVFEKLKSSSPNVIMTLHDRGARIYYAGEEVFVPGVATTALDTTGAGDMFAGGFLYAITHGLPTYKAGQLACFLASAVVSQIGPRLKCDVEKLAGMEEFISAQV